MKKELLNIEVLFASVDKSFTFAVTYCEYYKENEVDDRFRNGINPKLQTIECENADFFTNSLEAYNRFRQLRKIKKYHRIRIFQQDNGIGGKEIIL